MSPESEHQLQSFTSRIYSQALGVLPVVRAHYGTLILRCVGHLCLLFAKWDGELLSIGLLLTERLYFLKIWMHACFVFGESFWHFTAVFMPALR
jgi:hypothetical protein